MTFGLADLPVDILFEVAGYLDLKADVLNLASSASTASIRRNPGSCLLQGKHLFFGLLPALYDDVRLDTSEQCEATLSMLNKRPEVARHLQKLVVRFSPASGRHSRMDTNNFVASLVRRLAPKLDALNTFIWDAEEMPHSDDVWFALQMSCPRLHTVGTSYGARLPEHRNCLFQFKNLRGFMLVLKPGFYDTHSDALQESRLWDMLIRRCPGLEELHISGAPFLPVSVVHPLCYARWPRLRSLSLGDIVLDWQPRGGGVKAPFIAFLEAHPHLRSLRTSRAALNPAFLSSLEQYSLPRLTRFGGSLEHLQGLARIHSQITSVAIDEPLVIRDMAPLLAAGSAYEGGSLVRSIVGACPRLTKLELICTRSPSFTIDTFAKIIRVLPRLHHLRLTLVRSRQEEPLPLCAALLARSNPQLRTFSITFISPALPLPVPLSTEISVNGGEPSYRYLESGNYVLRTDEHGLPASLVCTERKTSRTFPLSLPAVETLLPLSTPTKKYRYEIDLRPKTKKGLGLIFEKSAAGEEIRALMMILSLGGVALWMFFG
ncbi:hypothetical protein ID866_2459 [Astraeus odoratus]|nr:hypothetical protein ID866_2459 [Astraeus odoratus]